MQQQETLLAALAGLWHDAGKIAQRAGERGSRLNDQETERDYGHYHALLTADAVERLAPPAWRDELVLAAGGHHRPQTKLAAFVSVADFLSSGERADENAVNVRCLQSLFSSLKGYNQPCFYPLKPLRPDLIFPLPQAEMPGPGQLDADYRALWQALQEEAGRLPGAHLQAYLEGLLDILQRYAWAIPSAYYRAVPDISLYDHSRMTGALAACLSADGRSLEWALDLRRRLISNQAPKDEPVALLVGGDLSGIQDYLYNTASSGAARSLCGRSFYLQLVTEAAALMLLEAAQVPLTNLIYAGGGYFNLLLPASSQDALQACYQRLVQTLLQAHEGKLALSVAAVPLPAALFLDSAFGKARRALGEQLAREKHRRLAVLGSSIASQVGSPLSAGGHPDQECLICGREGRWEPDEDGSRKCSFCSSLEELGRSLGKAEALALGSVPPESGPVRTWQDGLRHLGFDVQVLTRDNSGTAPPDPAQFTRIWHYQAGVFAPGQTTVPTAHSTRFLPVVVPQARDRLTGRMVTATFEDLAEASATDIKQWGVLRMDVDDLGALFHQGIERSSLSRVASLSSQFRLFFEGLVPQLVRQLNHAPPERARGQQQDRIYLIYAGGDDLFAVGTWDLLPNLANEIRQAFRRFTGGNPHVTLSGGISIFPQKYPLYLAAKEAGKALDDQAKEFQRTDGTAKDALSFLDLAVGWEEYPALSEGVERWQRWIEQKIVPRAVIQLLRRACERAMQPDSRGKSQLGPDTWRMVYALARRRQEAESLAKRQPQHARDVEATIAELNRIEAVFVQDNRQEQQRLALLARWTEFLTRGGAA